MKSWHVTSDQKGDKSQTKRIAREKPEEGGNLASSRAEVREVDRPLTEPSHPEISGASPVFGIISRRHSVCIGESTHVSQGNWEKSEPVPCKEGPQLFQVEVKNRMAMPCLPTVSPLSWPTAVGLSQLCSLVTSLCPSGWWLLSDFHILHLSLYFRLSYPHLFPCLSTQLNYKFPWGYFSLCSQHPVQCNGPIQAMFLDWMIRFL